MVTLEKSKETILSDVIEDDSIKLGGKKAFPVIYPAEPVKIPFGIFESFVISNSLPNALLTYKFYIFPLLS